MKRHRVNSSSIISAAYHPEKKILEVEFPNRHVYQYYNVSRLLYRSLMNALSIGAFFNKFIRNAGYEFRKIR